LVPQDFPGWMLELSRYDFSQSVLEAGISASRLVLQRQIRAPFYDPERMDSTLWKRKEADYARSRASGAAMRAVALHKLIAELPRLDRPNCLIWGAEDPVVNPAGAQALAELLPDAEYHLLAECGHAPQLEQTGKTAQIVRQFLPQTVSPRLTL
jgi:pimeloyl-ACP methyl ester carboxylesterase